MGHRQHGDDEVDQSKDAVEPQEVVPERHTHKKKKKPNAAVVISTSCLPPSPSRRSLKTSARRYTHSALTLASVVLPKFSGLSPVGGEKKNAT